MMIRKVFQQLALMTRAQKYKLTLLILMQSILGLLDILGIALIGIVGAITASNLTYQTLPSLVRDTISLIGLENLSVTTQVTLLAVASILILILRTVASAILTRKSLLFLSRISADISKDVMERTLKLPLNQIQTRENQHYIYAINDGIPALILGIVGNAANAVVDFNMLSLLFLTLFIFDPITSIIGFIFFGLVGGVMYRHLRLKGKSLGEQSGELTIEASQVIRDSLEAYRELLVRNAVEIYTSKLYKTRKHFGKIQAEISFIPYLSKYVFESSVIVGGTLIAGVQFIRQDAQTALTTLTVFVAASTRILPSILRFQQSLIQVNTAIGTGKAAETLMDALSSQDASSVEKHSFVIPEFQSRIEIRNLSFSYPDSTSHAIHEFNLEIEPGELVAICGPSGSGKSTLVDLVIGALKPDRGEVLISGVDPRTSFCIWEDKVSFMSQNFMVQNSRISDNVTFPDFYLEEQKELVEKALVSASLNYDLSGLGIDSPVGERGESLSGGEKQRLGLARALFRNPEILILDEFTSALDQSTEDKVMRTIERLRGKVTILIIAHRLRTLQSADKIVYIEQGKAQIFKSIEEAQSAIPSLTGLSGFGD